MDTKDDAPKPEGVSAEPTPLDRDGDGSASRPIDVGDGAKTGEAKSDDAAKADAPKADEPKAEAKAEEPKAEAKAEEPKAAEATDAAKPAEDADKAITPAKPAPQKPSSTGTIAGVLSLVILLGGVVATIFMARRNEATGGKHPSAEHQKKKGKKGGPKKDTTPWNVGDKVPVVITVLPEDVDNLVCAAKEEIGGKHCAYQSKDAAWPKAEDAKDDKLILRPYATMGQRRLIASGFWSQLGTPLPEKRFATKCTFVIEGKLEHPWVKFRKSMEFKEVKDAWFAGTLTDCSIQGGPAGAHSAQAAGSAEPAAPSAAPSAHPSANPSAHPTAK